MANFKTDKVLVPPVSFVHDCVIEMKCDEVPGSRLTSSKTLDVILSFETASPPFEYSSNSICPWGFDSNQRVCCRFVPDIKMITFSS